MVWAKDDPRLDPLRAEPRFQAILPRMSFRSYPLSCAGRSPHVPLLSVPAYAISCRCGIGE